MMVKPSVLDLRNYLAAPANDIAAEAPIAFKDRVIDLFYGEGKDVGGRLPWIKTHPLIKFRPGEVTMWAGFNGHGKSQVTTVMALDMAFNGERVAIGSFEMAPERTLYRMVRQAARDASPSVTYINAFLSWFENNLLIMNKRGTVDVAYVAAAIRYCKDKFGITQFIVDNLAKCVRGEDDYSGQKNFIDEMTTVALDTKVHIHIVHHLRKGMSEYDEPNKMDIKGAGGIVDLIDNAVLVWRNKKKEMAIANPNTQEKERLFQQKLPDCKLIVCKQRNGSWEGSIGLWYHAPSMSYSEDALGLPKRYDITKEVTLI